MRPAEPAFCSARVGGRDRIAAAFAGLPRHSSVLGDGLGGESQPARRAREAAATSGHWQTLVAGRSTVVVTFVT
jgi:hypothetical protein